MSSKLSSLAFDDVQEQGQILDGADFAPDLQIVKPRAVSRYDFLSSVTTHNDVVSVRGKFTVSF